MTTIAAEHISLRTPAALCCALPHLLGFHPEHSAVLVWLANGRLILTQRMDLPTMTVHLDDWTAAVWAHRAADVADEMVIVLCIDDVAAASPGCDLVAGALQARAHASEIDVRDVIVLGAGRWRSLLCDDTACCPPEGQEIPICLRESVAMTFDIAGGSPHASRSDVVASLDRVVSESDAVEATGVLGRAGSRSRSARERWRDSALANLMAWISPSPGRSTPQRQAHLLLGVRDLRVRDGLLWHVARAEGLDLRVVRDQLCELVRCAPVGETAPVATVTAVVCWLLGDGLRAAVLADRALEDDPDYSLAGMLSASIGGGLPPDQWRNIMGSLSWEVCRYGEDLPHERQPL